jgi:regulator of replication initiation timing
MNKIQRAISDCKQHIKNLETERMILMAEMDAYKKQLDNLEAIERNKGIPHDDCHKPVNSNQ